MKALSISLIIFLFTSLALASDHWTKTDSLYQISYSLLHVMDWGQTLEISRNPDRWEETNPILGEHPSTGSVNTYFATTLLAHAAISYLLPGEYRRIWQVLWIGIEGGTVVRNYSIGIRCQF